MRRLPLLQSIAVAALLLSFAPAAPAVEEADGVLKRAAAAMGANDLKTLRYAGRGMGASFGQAYVPGMAWPKLTYSSYVREVDYDNVFTNEEVRRTRAEPKGGGGIPLTGEQLAGVVANATRAWNTAGPNAAPRQAALAGRLHDLWITPHGVIKAAMKAKSRLDFRNIDGRSLAAVSFTEPGIMTATAFINDDYLVERVESRMPDPVLGDTPVVTTYSDYRDYGGVKFPSRIEQQAGGAMTLSLMVTEVKPNAPVNTAVPDNVAKWSERVASEKVTDGVWFLAGGSHNSVAIERSDHMMLIESPLDDGRASAVIEAARKLVPGKPVRYVVNSHNHFDHSGGLRAAAAEGATIITQAQNKPYFERVFANPNRIAPDMLAKSGRKPRIVAVGDKMVMNDAARPVELYRIQDTVHGDTLLMVYLPREKLLIEADVFTPGPPNAPAPAAPNALNLDLMKNVDRANLQVDRILPLHGRVVPVAELHRMVGK